MPDSKIRFAVIGFGHIGQRHAEMIDRNQRCELVGIIDIEPSKSEIASQKYKVPFFESAEKFFTAGITADVICVCSPNGLHARHSIMALEKKAHVVVEKPMGLHRSECEEVLHKALTVHRQVFCVMQNRYSPPSAWLKELVDSNALGKIFMVQVNCYWNRDHRYYKAGNWKGTRELDGGVLFTQFSHFIDIMYWIFGDIKNIQAKFENFTHKSNTEFADDSGFVSFNFVNGGLGTFNYSTAVWDINLESSMTIIAEKGSVKVGGQYMDKVEYCHIENYTMPQLAASNPPNDYGGYKGSAANHHFVIDNVVETLTGNTTVSTNALEGMKVVDIIERIYLPLQKTSGV